MSMKNKILKLLSKHLSKELTNTNIHLNNNSLRGKFNLPVQVVNNSLDVLLM